MYARATATTPVAALGGNATSHRRRHLSKRVWMPIRPEPIGYGTPNTPRRLLIANDASTTSDQRPRNSAATIFAANEDRKGMNAGQPMEVAGLFDKQAEIYVKGRPTYPKEWYSTLAALTPQHSLAWDVGTGNGQATVGLVEHYDQVVASDISEAQLKYAIQHPRVRYIHTPTSISDDEMVDLIGGGHENSVDLVTVAAAIHWFDLPRFYSLVKRLLRQPGGIIAVWCYNGMVVSPDFDLVMKRFLENCLQFWDPRTKYAWEGYTTLPFPFEMVGLGREGKPIILEIAKELSFQGVERMLRSFSAVATAKDRGVDLLSEDVIKELHRAWGAHDLVRSVTYKAFMLVGKL
ncbi:hypothetical protein ABKV19_014331 [Rosa sericea]